MKALPALFLFCALACAQAPPAKKAPAIGYDDTPMIPGQKWRVHDINRPRPRIITPPTESTQERPGRPPSDAIVLFDGKDLSQWVRRSREGGPNQSEAPGWKIENGYMEVVPGAGHLATKEKFGDIQIHVEWAAPAVARSSSQERGNSGVIFMGRYEIQILDSYDNVSYADGQAASIYNQRPPLVNASRRPGEWQYYDIVFEAPRFREGKLVRPAYFTVFHNGIVVHNRQEVLGPMAHRRLPPYEPHEPEEPLVLQNHGDPIRFRNIWVRRLKGYDEQ
jgi:hypothetical protein